jgi:S-adenosylmethionine decarboxylase
MGTNTRRVVVSTKRKEGKADARPADFALARHLTVEFYDCDPGILADEGRVERALLLAAQESGATIVDSRFHTFEPQGVSGVVIIAESHFTVHTWPEHDYAAVDLFTCSPNLDFDTAIKSMTTSLESEGVMVSADLHRGIPWNNGRERLVPTNGGRSKHFTLSWKEQFEKTKAWGLSTSVDVYHCDAGLIRDADAIRKFVHELCERLEMRRFGDCQVVDFGEEERVSGYSMTQLIETSLISGHFANASNSAYLDIFSCKYYEPRLMAEFAASYFKGSNYRMQVSLRR